MTIKKRIFFSLLLLIQALSFVLPAAVLAESKQGLVIIVNAQEFDSRGHGSIPLDDLHLSQELKSTYPNDPSVTIVGNTNQQIHDQLAQVVASHPQMRVDALYVVAHGGMIDWKTVSNGETYAKTTNGEKGSVIFNESRSFAVILNQKESVEKTFGPVLGRFSDDARIIFSSCNTVSDDKKESQKIMQDVTENFQLRNGSLYMSRTEDSSFDDFLLNEPICQLPDQTEAEQAEKLQAIVAHATSLISAPILGYIAHHVVNQGYVLEEKNGKTQFSAASRFQALSK